MSSLYKTYKTDAEKEIKGVEITFEPNEDGTVPTFIISRIAESNKEYTKALDAATKPYRRQMQLGTLPKAKDKAIFLDVFVSTIVLGWSNVQGEDGQNIPFNKANAIKLFTDLPDLLTELQVQASDAALFRVTALEDEAKN